MAVGGLPAPFSFWGVSGGLGGFDALQVERFPVSPQRVWLRDFRAVEAVKLACLQAIEAGTTGGGPAGFHPAVGEKAPFAFAAIGKFNLSGEHGDIASFHCLLDVVFTDGIRRLQEKPLFRQVFGFRKGLLLGHQREWVFNRPVGYGDEPFPVGGFQEQGAEVNPARPKFIQAFRTHAHHHVTVNVAHRVDHVAQVVTADGVVCRKELDAVVLVEDLGEFDGFHGFTSWQFARMS